MLELEKNKSGKLDGERKEKSGLLSVLTTSIDVNCYYTT